jgi:transcriptional regulator with XRE-family HTH domain
MKKSILAKNIKKLRAFKNVNQTEFARLFDTKRSSIGAYEEGRAEPKLETLIKIVDYFKLSLDDLVKKELTINQITKFDKNFEMHTNQLDLLALKKEIKQLNQTIKTLDKKIDTLLLNCK